MDNILFFKKLGTFESNALESKPKPKLAWMKTIAIKLNWIKLISQTSRKTKIQFTLIKKIKLIWKLN